MNDIDTHGFIVIDVGVFEGDILGVSDGDNDVYILLMKLFISL